MWYTDKYCNNISGLDLNVSYLNNSDIEIERYKFYDVPKFIRLN